MRGIWTKQETYFWIRNKPRFYVGSLSEPYYEGNDPAACQSPLSISNPSAIGLVLIFPKIPKSDRVGQRTDNWLYVSNIAPSAVSTTSISPMVAWGYHYMQAFFWSLGVRKNCRPTRLKFCQPVSIRCHSLLENRLVGLKKRNRLFLQIGNLDRLIR